MIDRNGRKIVTRALEMDIGRGDLTSEVLVDDRQTGRAVLWARQELVACGLPVMAEVFSQVDGRIRLEPACVEGAVVGAGEAICRVEGPARGILTGERVALNFFQNLSAIATVTRRYVERVAGTKARVVDTRKTTPGLGSMQKYAVRTGGGHNHRLGLDDGILVKENHLALAGGITAAVARLRARVGHLHRIEVECETLAQVEEALAVGVEVILLDNMDLAGLRRAVALVAGRAILEASGNVTLETIRGVAETGVDLISVGALTHSAGSVDVSLRVE
ncbi:putative nicotinate-nucleotide pyrophosphorylase [carboxylating] [Candidatus Magnetaquicoccaceae bacterium FCR-1]|uniref:nicotinate-nucleotide diphosphorylase (carboxylating) n=1 Tax=Candidatus Magnetaquiglobus chichijimensis TaxID=3141448 RepID=A0ABQ0CCH9_9PROT